MAYQYSVKLKSGNTVSKIALYRGYLNYVQDAKSRNIPSKAIMKYPEYRNSIIKYN